MGSVRVAIVGVGNCASSLVQGVEYYRDADPSDSVPGLMHVAFGDYHVTRRRVRRRVRRRRPRRSASTSSEAINASREQHHQDRRRARPSASTVQRGPTLDGLGKYYRQTIDESGAEPVDVVAGRSSDRQVDVLVSYLPVGSEEADKFYAQCCHRRRRGVRQRAARVHRLRPGVGQEVRPTPASPIVGDDIKSQVGATITHRVLAKLFEDRGVAAGPHLPAQLRRQHGLHEHAGAQAPGVQEDLEDPGRHVQPDRPLAGKVDDRNVHIGPSDHVPWLDDRKWAYIRLEGRAFGDAPLNLEYKLEVWDSPNSAGVIIDAVRAAKIAQDRGIGGPILLGVGVPHEVPAGAATRRRGPPPRRGLHRR